ncbi:MAG: ABC transporter substrate-binding protein [Chloroflexaceae bacterium]|nr:ABC transporter substrate-binding protein [Chloroflexaceae bacterium]
MWNSYARYVWYGSCVLLMLLSMSCGSTTESSHVKVAIVLPGGLPEVYEAVQRASDMALAERTPNTSEREIDIIFVGRDGQPDDMDTGEKPAEPSHTNEQRALMQVVDDKQVVAVLGGYSSDEARETIPFLNQFDIPYVSAFATWPGLTKPGYAPGEPGIYYPGGHRTFFRVVPGDDVQAIVAAAWMKRKRLDDVYIVANKSAYAESLANIFLARTSLEGLKIVGHETFDQLDTHQQDALARRIAQAKPKVIYYPVDRSVDYTLVETIRTRNPDVPIVGGDALLYLSLPDSTEGIDDMYATSIAPPVDTVAGAEFVEQYRGTYGTLPDTSTLSLYEALRVVFKAIDNAEEPTRLRVLEAMHNLGEISGVMGTWSFDAYGDTSLQTINLLHIQDGKWVSLEEVG